MRRRIVLGAVLLLCLAGAAFAVAGPGASETGPLVEDPAGVIDLPAGYSYTTLAQGCEPAQSTESGAPVVMPDDFDGNALFQAPEGQMWLLSNHELTQPREGDFQGDLGKCHVNEQRPGDDDSDGWGAVSRLVLAKDGTTVLSKEVITTGLHNLCAVSITPWKTYLTNEEFPFLADRRSGWVWEIDPATGAQKRLPGMGWMSHEQLAFASNGSWYMTDDRGDARFVYKFIPDNRRDLTTGELYGLAFNKVTLTGTWVGPLNPADPDADMRARGFNPETSGFVKIEGIVTQGGSHSVGGNYLVFSESGAGPDPGRIWKLTHLGNNETVRGEVLVEGDFARLSRPDNLRFNDAGDLFIMEDHSTSDFRRIPDPPGPSNQVWILPRHQEGAGNLVLFADTGLDEPTGPWFSFDNQLLYLSIQTDPPRPPGRVIAIRHPHNFNQPYDR